MSSMYVIILVQIFLVLRYKPSLYQKSRNTNKNIQTMILKGEMQTYAPSLKLMILDIKACQIMKRYARTVSAIGRVLAYNARSAREFSAWIKCWHSNVHSRFQNLVLYSGHVYYLDNSIWVAIGRVVAYNTRSAREFSAGIKCWHSNVHSRFQNLVLYSGHVYMYVTLSPNNPTHTTCWCLMPRATPRSSDAVFI